MSFIMLQDFNMSNNNIPTNHSPAKLPFLWVKCIVFTQLSYVQLTITFEDTIVVYNTESPVCIAVLTGLEDITQDINKEI